MPENIIKYGLKNVHYAKATYDSKTEKYKYDAPVRIPGAVNLSMSSKATIDNFYADDGIYATINSNPGYEGSAEFALLPESFKKDVLGEEGASGITLENSDALVSDFALLFEFKGDKKKTRHIFYRTSCTRPDIAGQTTEEKNSPQTEKLNLTAAKRLNDGYIHASVAEGTSLYDDWYTAVTEPEAIKAITDDASVAASVGE